MFSGRILRPVWRWIHAMNRSVSINGPLLAALSALLLICCGQDRERTASPEAGDSTAEFQLYTYRIVNIYNHALDAYTQGLVYQNGYLYEGTGLHGESSLRKVELETGEVIQRHDLASEHFGEGITILGDSIFQLTWTSGRGFIYGTGQMDSIGEFTYPYYPWGLTDDGSELIMSDGSDTIYFLSPATFRETGRVNVCQDSVSIDDLNELEYIEGKLFANVYRSHNIMIIDPLTGRVTGRINLNGIRDGCVPAPGAGVLNGIAYDAETGRIFVTGKNWPELFEIELLPADNQ